MATVHLSAATASAMADAITAQVDAGSAAGTIRIYDGTMPASTADAVSTQNLLAELTFSDPSFGGASDGTITAASITADASADATGTATWARVADSDDTVIMDLDVGESGDGAAMTLNTASLVAGGEVAITAFSITVSTGVA